MEQRTLGRTGLKVGVLGFGCGDVGGLKQAVEQYLRRYPQGFRRTEVERLSR